METEAPLPQSQVPATCPYFESTASKVPKANAYLNWYNIIKNMFAVNILFDSPE